MELFEFYCYIVGDAEKDANCRKFMERAMPECFQKVIKMLDNLHSLYLLIHENVLVLSYSIRNCLLV